MTEQITQRRYDTLYQAKATPITGSTLPSTGVRDGDQIRYKALATSTTAINDVIWIFTYDAASAYWYPANGAPAMYDFDATSAPSSITTTWQVAAAPSIIIPLAGDYDVFVESAVTQSVAGTTVEIGPATNAAPTAVGFAAAGFGIGELQTLDWRSRMTGLAVGDDLRHTQFTFDGTPTHSATSNRALWVTPMRVH